MSAVDPLTGLPVEFVRMLAVKIDPHADNPTKPLDDFFAALKRAQSFRMTRKAAEADSATTRARRPTSMNAETQNASNENASNENATIENALTIVNNKPPAVVADGWDMAAIDMSANPMAGLVSARFDNGGYFTGKEKTPLETSKRYVAIDLREGWMFLKRETPPEYSMRPIGGAKPSRPDSFTNEDEWPFKLNSTTERDDPWKYNRFVFLLDPQSAAVIVFNTHSVGGDIGVNELAKAIQTRRNARPGAVPIVELQSRQWKNRYGTRPRPFFNIVGWHFKDEKTDDDGQGNNVKTVNAFDDECPF